MKKLLPLLFLLLLAHPSYASGHEANITIFIEGTIGVNITGSCIVGGTCPAAPPYYEAKLGKEEGCLITIENEANIRDVITLKARIANPVLADHEGWVRFDFTCVETVGECNGTEVRNMQIDPSVKNTSVFLGMKGFKLSSGDPTQIEIRGFSNTNFTVEQLGCVMLDVQPEAGGFNPLNAPIMEGPLMLMFAMISAGGLYHIMQKSRFKKTK